MAPYTFKKPNDGIPKPQHLRELPGYLYCRAFGFFSRLFYIVRLVWDTAPVMLILLALFCLAEGLLPVAGAYITSALMNEIARLLAETSSLGSQVFDTLRPVVFLLIFEFLYLFARRVIARLSGIVTSLSGEMVTNHIKIMIIEKAKTVDQASFDRPEFYEKLENANREAGMRPIHILTATFKVISAVISVVSFIIVLSTLSPLAPLIVLLASVPGAVINYYYRNRNFRYLRGHSKDRREMNYYSNTMVNKDYAKEIKLLGLGDTFVDKYKQAFKRYFAGLKRIILREGLWQTLVSFLVVGCNCALFLYVAYTIVYENGQIGDYSLYTGALSSIAGYVTTLVTSTASIYEGTLFIDNMMQFMAEESTVVASADEPACPVRGEHVLALEHVSFCYPGSDTYVIRDINLTFRSGERTVLVGLNGAGKTTLIKLITRLYDPTEGRITLDGVDIRSYDPHAYHALFGIIFQDYGKYAVSAKENIVFGDVRRAVDDADVQRAAEQGNAADFIRDLPHGYDTPLTRIFEEDGIELSGGQWQKLAVSRAFYKSSDILILDEPTAALDALAEQEVFRQFKSLADGRISIFVSHRLSGAVDADQIIVLEKGCVCEIGTHEQLMEKGGRYFLLFSTQASRYTGEVY